ncbi:MAG: hypothetical protein QGG73_02925 [Candidatus Hydrogenedentes bacterium]|nr:hypothetical protein [Candidatus Hydrogenedentota bacterium]
MESITILEATIVLIVVDLVLIGAGILVFKKWIDDGESPPTFFVLGAWTVAFILYGAVTRFLFLHGYNNHDTLPILLYCVLFWSAPVVYYGQVLLTALSTRRGASYSWLSVDLPKDDSFPMLGEFSEAQALAAQGNIDQAIEVYTSYMAERPRAIMAAAALLESHSRYEEAARHLHELLDQGVENTSDWARATLQLANLSETHLGKDDDAITLYNQVILRVPDSVEEQLATSNLARLRPDGDSLLDMLDAGFNPSSPPQPDAPAQSQQEDS